MVRKEKLSWDKIFVETFGPAYCNLSNGQSYLIGVNQENCLCLIFQDGVEQPKAYLTYNPEEGITSYKDPKRLLDNRKLFHQPLNRDESWLVRLMFQETSKTLIPRITDSQ